MSLGYAETNQGKILYSRTLVLMIFRRVKNRKKKALKKKKILIRVKAKPRSDRLQHCSRDVFILLFCIPLDHCGAMSIFTHPKHPFPTTTGQ